MNVHINDSSVWRAFEDSELTHSAAHYLMTIMHLRQQQGYARVTDVAEHLRVSRGAASRATSLLKERGWIQEDPHRMLELTEDGLELARSVQRNYLIVECFLEDILHIPAGVAREDACKMEHLLSPETTTALFRMIRVMMRDPELRDALSARLSDPNMPCEHSGRCEICYEFGQCLAEEARERDDARASRAASLAEHAASHSHDHDHDHARARTLADLQPGESGIVRRLQAEGDTQRQILDMGISKGVRIEIDGANASRDQLNIKLRGYSLTLAKTDAQLIEILEEDRKALNR